MVVFNSMTFIKYSYLSDIHRCSLEQTPTLTILKKNFQTQVPNLPSDYYVYYYDNQGDVIAVKNDIDLAESIKFFGSSDPKNPVRLYISSVNPNEDWAAKLLKKVDMPYLCDVSTKKYQDLEKTLFDLAVQAEKGVVITVDSSRKLFNKISQKISGEEPNFIYRIQANVECKGEHVSNAYDLQYGQLKTVTLKISNIGSVPWPKDTFMSFSAEDKNVNLMEGPVSLSGLLPGKAQDIRVTLKGQKVGIFRCFWQIDSEDAIIPCIVPIKVNVKTGPQSSRSTQKTEESFEEIQVPE